MIGDDGLRDAITDFTQWISDIISAGHQLPAEQWNAPLFTCLITKKQFNQLNSLCQKHNWPRQRCPGITVYPRHISHILSSRAKDRLSWQDVAKIISLSYSARSQVALNKGRMQQGIVLNASEAIRIGKGKYYGMAIIQVSENSLAPVTAYHASEAKVRAITK
ncbi:hypothetical protein J2125_002412 [Erwinia toletana]|uniref:Uncharacterized protein n=1 Tax=Winslowiella toletana TaxID=92490 RepID=A0ABS4P9B1_9GAMM|nr:hypothetical protein [Winslowiella toletana]MBP2169220.1 hypothetical protein [Winslowiella toletana]